MTDDDIDQTNARIATTPEFREWITQITGSTDPERRGPDDGPEIARRLAEARGQERERG